MRWTLVLPNLSAFRSRGMLKERWALASKLGCGAAEVPADLVKSAREEERTAQSIGEVLSESTIATLYGPPFPNGRFILHTDPGIPRRGLDGVLVVPPLRWGDREWAKRYALGVAEMIRAIGGGIEAVEVHPGQEQGGVEELAAGVAEFSEALAQAAGAPIPILMENKHRHRMAWVEDMGAVMDALTDKRYGLVVDISNLWKTYRSRTALALEGLPWARVKAVHLHFRHRAPRYGDPVDWGALFQIIREKGTELLVNPEVFHRAELMEAIAMVRSGLGGSDRTVGPNAISPALRS